MNPESFSVELLAIRERFVESLPDRLLLLEEAMSSLTWSTTNKPGEAFETLYNLTHQLVGTAGSVGFPALSDFAKSLNLLLLEMKGRENQVVTDQTLTEITTHFSALTAEAHRCIRSHT